MTVMCKANERDRFKELLSGGPLNKKVIEVIADPKPGGSSPATKQMLSRLESACGVIWCASNTEAPAWSASRTLPEVNDILIWLADHAGTDERRLESGLLLDAGARLEALYRSC